MKKWIIIIFVVAGIIWAVSDFVMSSNERKEAIPENKVENHYAGSGTEIGLEQGNIAPDFELETVNGETVKLSDFRGEKIMLNFWATWCPPCRAEMPDMQKVYDEEEITVLGVNMTGTEKSEEVIIEFVEDFELTFPILMDKTSELMNTYHIQAYPTTYMIDSNGKIQFVALGPMNDEQMLQYLNSMD